MQRVYVWGAAIIASICGIGAASAQSVCGGEVILQCATDTAEFREQITVCASGQSYILTRHALSSGEMTYDPALVANANADWFSWEEGDQARLEMGFWNTDLAEPILLHVEIPWDDMNETVADQGDYAMWLQSPPWRAHVDQTLCAPNTIYADPAALWAAQRDRGPVGRFFSHDEIVPNAATVARARVSDASVTADGVPVYASARPSAATPSWWMLQPGEIVEVLDHAGAYSAVAIPTNGVSDCMIRPEQLGQPYTGPCATGWVAQRDLDRIQ